LIGLLTLHQPVLHNKRHLPLVGDPEAQIGDAIIIQMLPYTAATAGQLRLFAGGIVCSPPSSLALSPLFHRGDAAAGFARSLTDTGPQSDRESQDTF
jgi:hypothetical protein